jgi:hypothetical protein
MIRVITNAKDAVSAVSIVNAAGGNGFLTWVGE